MKKIVEEKEDFAFYVKMLPLKTHPAAYRKSKAIVCEKSLRLLERAFDGKSIPNPNCETTEVDDTIELAERLGISGTPTIILPDGGVIRGFKDAPELISAIETAGLAVEEKERRAMEAEQEAQEKQAEGEQIEQAGQGETPREEAAEDAGVRPSGDVTSEQEDEAGEVATEKKPAEEEPKKKKRWWLF